MVSLNKALLGPYFLGGEPEKVPIFYLKNGNPGTLEWESWTLEWESWTLLNRPFWGVGKLPYISRIHTAYIIYIGLLGQWLNFKLFGITYLVGKIKFKLFFQGPLAKWVGFRASILGTWNVWWLKSNYSMVIPMLFPWCRCYFLFITLLEVWLQWLHKSFHTPLTIVKFILNALRDDPPSQDAEQTTSNHHDHDHPMKSWYILWRLHTHRSFWSIILIPICWLIFPGTFFGKYTIVPMDPVWYTSWKSKGTPPPPKPPIHRK